MAPATDALTHTANSRSADRSAPPLPERLASRMVNGILAIKPLFNIAKAQARQMMIQRAESIGVAWTDEAQRLQQRDWSQEFAQVNNPQLIYPDYYLRPFHAYDTGNLSWQAATEVEVAAYAVHAKIWPDAGAQGDRWLRQSYHKALQASLTSGAPEIKEIVDLGCSVGMSTAALQETFPDAHLTGVDLSPYFLAVAQYQTEHRTDRVTELTAETTAETTWLHAAAEATGLPSASVDLVSACLMFHELPQQATVEILQEARRLLRSGGHLAIMDMNPQSQIYAKMPAYVLTLLKSTEPYLDDYFSFDFSKAIVAAGFAPPTITANSPRHRTLVAQAV